MAAPETDSAAPMGPCIGDGGNQVRQPYLDSTSAPARKQSPQAKWAEKNPLKRWAHLATASAIKRGLLVRQPCEICGDPRTDFHHPDHRFPLIGRWACRLHHKQMERALKCEAADG